MVTDISAQRYSKGSGEFQAVVGISSGICQSLIRSWNLEERRPGTPVKIGVRGSEVDLNFRLHVPKSR